jgi:hypothetical protein
MTSSLPAVRVIMRLAGEGAGDDVSGKVQHGGERQVAKQEIIVGSEWLQGGGGKRPGGEGAR